jgi:hypothetical protein
MVFKLDKVEKFANVRIVKKKKEKKSRLVSNRRYLGYETVSSYKYVNYP